MRDEPSLPEPEPRRILLKLFDTCQGVRAFIQKVVYYAPETSSFKLPNPSKEISNPTRMFDRVAEEWFVNSVNPQKGPLFAGKIDALGEENPLIKTADYRSFRGTVFLGDMVDGSDLVLANLGNWCTTAVCFSTVKKRILAAVVAHADGSTYFARDDLERARVSTRQVNPRPSGPEISDLNVDATLKKISEAKVCYYGQKRGHIIVPPKAFSEAMGELGRLYNLAGNPMMAKLAEGRVHAVFDLIGQKAHDVVPGAYIALKAGAVMSTPEGRMIDEGYLYEKLLEPSKPISYVLAASESLRNEICEKLHGFRTI